MKRGKFRKQAKDRYTARIKRIWSRKNGGEQ
jgi:hypothetical protein